MGLSLKDINNRDADNAEQDQTARMFSLILLCTVRPALCKINSWWRTAGLGLTSVTLR